jgi:hypothetical protein
MYWPLQTTQDTMGLPKFETRVTSVVFSGFSTLVLECDLFLSFSNRSPLSFQLGDDILTSGISNELEHYQDKASYPGDQQKAAQLLTSLRYGEQAKHDDFVNRRPKTAGAALGKWAKFHFFHFHFGFHASIFL